MSQKMLTVRLPQTLANVNLHESNDWLPWAPAAAECLRQQQQQHADLWPADKADRYTYDIIAIIGTGDQSCWLCL